MRLVGRFGGRQRRPRRQILLQEGHHFFPGDGQPDAVAIGHGMGLGADDADDDPEAVEQRPAAVARIDAAIQLDHRLLVGAIGDAADDALGDDQAGLAEVFPRVACGGEADGADPLPFLHPGEQRHGRHLDVGGDFGLHQREVDVGVLGDEFCREDSCRSSPSGPGASSGPRRRDGWSPGIHPRRRRSRCRGRGAAPPRPCPPWRVVPSRFPGSAATRRR